MLWLQKIAAIGVLSLLLFSHGSLHLFGQAQNQYVGPLEVQGYQGNAEFGYKLVDGDTLLNGTFQLQQANLPALLSNVDHHFFFRGSFDNNIPIGFWQFKFGEFGTVQETKVVDYQYRVKVSGEQHETSGMVVNGKPHGLWTQTIQRVEGSAVAETLFKSTLQFDRGIPQKSFQIQNTKMTLLGRFLRGGLAHDIWELYSVESPDATERWFFAEGRLEKVVLQSQGVTQTFQAYTGKIQNPISINIDSRYLEVVKLLLLLNTEGGVELQGGMNSLLAQNAGYYRKIDKILGELGESDFMPDLKVKVDHYPLNQNEKRQLDSIKLYHAQAEKTCLSLLKSTQLHIMQLADEEVLFYLSALSAIHDNYLSFVGQIVDYQEAGILEHVPRQSLVSKLWPGGFSNTVVNVRYEEGDSIIARTYTGPKADAYRFEQPGIEALSQMNEYLYYSVESIHEKLNEKLSKRELQEELKALEEELISSATHFNQLVDSLRHEVTGSPVGALKNVKSSVKQALSQYSTMEDLAIKPDRAKYLTSCLGQMEELSIAVAKLPSRSEELKKKYTDRVWNPFTSTVMDEEVKKRIIEAYDNVLVPYLLEEVKTNLSCDNALEIKGLIDKSYQRMLTMREETTDRVERKLKKERDPQVVMQLFNIDNGKVVEQ